MFKIIAIYKKPDDVESFEKYYNEVHTPLVKKIPGLKELRITRIKGAPFGQTDIYLIAEMIFETKEDYKKALSSKEAMEAGQDALKFSNNKVEIILGEENIIWI